MANDPTPEQQGSPLVRLTECLPELRQKAAMLEFLRESKADADAGRTVPARESLECLGKQSRDKS
jgi:hypothetical protein